MKIIYDHRESKSIKSYVDDTFESACLTKGDYLITSPAGVHAVIERKSIPDFSASIKDGRYNNRNDFNGLNCPVYYIIEECAKHRRLSIPRDSIYKASYKLSFRDGIFPIFTNNVQDTVQHLKYMANALKDLDPSRVIDDAYFYTQKITDPAKESRSRILFGCPKFGEKIIATLDGLSICDIYQGDTKLTPLKYKLFAEYLRTSEAVLNIYRLTKKRAKKFMDEYPNGIIDYIEYGDDEYEIVTKAINHQ